VEFCHCEAYQLLLRLRGGFSFMMGGKGQVSLQNGVGMKLFVWLFTSLSGRSGRALNLIYSWAFVIGSAG
jgi:hypothetical protein